MVDQEKIWGSQIFYKKWKETKESTEMRKYKNVIQREGRKEIYY